MRSARAWSPCGARPGAECRALDVFCCDVLSRALVQHRAYDSDALRHYLKARSAWGCIKPKPYRKNIPNFSHFLYR